MRQRALLALALFAVLAVSIPVFGDTVIYSQPYNTSNAYLSDENDPEFEADDFVLSMNYDITDVHWWGVYSTVLGPEPASDDFTIAFHAEADSPEVYPSIASYAAGNVGRSDTGSTVAGYPIYAYSYDLSPALPLTGGVTYYLSIYNNTPDANWFWETGDGGNNASWYRFSLDDDWIPNSGYDLAFELTIEDQEPAIPEPLTCLLFGGSVLLGLGRLRRRLS